MSAPRRRRPTAHGKSPMPSPVPSHQVRLAAEYWLDVFTERLLQITADESNRGYTVSTVAEMARSLADAALSEYEQRWPGVKLP